MWLHYVFGWLTFLCNIVMGIWTIIVDRRRRRLYGEEDEVDFQEGSGCVMGFGGPARRLDGGGALGDLHESLGSPIIYGSIFLMVVGYAARFMNIYMKYNASLLYLTKLLH